MEKKKKRNIADSNISKSGQFCCITATPDETRKLGEKFAKKLKSGDIVFLKGDLGSGKTTFTQGIVKAFGNKSFAGSSSFILVNEYEAGKCKLFHIDLYRLNSVSVRDLGIEEYLFNGNIAVIEWPDRLLDFQNDNTWSIEIEAEENVRKIKIERKRVKSEKGKK
ncbi:MAG: tRNA (adenosine(37)-N6)-threonylcarbamoyltransferase complex ATPase subunit type 1 TsaE [Endomicrobia bacterium]|nr:tRNA (adenosine(37)-N6)-threonylcarbamoyltransferase complex ATPase subunit type 1 TsaE [Endomicrobiia bacterium]